MDIGKFSSWENYTALWMDHAWNNRCYNCFMSMSVKNIGRKNTQKILPKLAQTMFKSKLNMSI